MKSHSASKYNYYRSNFLTPEKKSQLSRLNTQTSTTQKDMLSVQSYLYEQSHIKEEASKKEIVRLIRGTIDNVERIKYSGKTNQWGELNHQLSRLLIGLRACINQPELSSYLIQLIQLIREVSNDHNSSQQLEFEQEKESLKEKTHELESRNLELQQEYRIYLSVILVLKLKEKESENKIQNYKSQLLEYQKLNKQLSSSKKFTKDTQQRQELKSHIQGMQSKIQTLSEKEKKLIQLVKAIKSRGVDIEGIFKKMSNSNVEENSQVIAKEEDIYVEASSHSEFGDHSQIESGPALIKRNKKFLLD